MKLSISNIAWEKEYDEAMYQYLEEQSFEGIEIAPTRIFPDNPYNRIDEAVIFASKMKEERQLFIASIQSIWYGRDERLFNSKEELMILLEYTQQAILFAEAIHCNNLVFGCPKSRNVNSASDIRKAIELFKSLGDYAYKHHTILAIEPNPVIYHTNFINTTEEAFELVKKVDSPGFKVNLDTGTMIYNNESLVHMNTDIKYINHVHISEPNLKPIEKREPHKELFDLLSNNNYEGYVSIEMGLQKDIGEIKRAAEYVKEVFKKKVTTNEHKYNISSIE